MLSLDYGPPVFLITKMLKSSRKWYTQDETPHYKLQKSQIVTPHIRKRDIQPHRETEILSNIRKHTHT